MPRETVDLKPYNEKLKSLCAYVENYDSFLLANGQLVDSFYFKDKLKYSWYEEAVKQHQRASPNGLHATS